MSIASINEWHQAARPEPTPEDFSVQLGCHFEEIAEMEDHLLWSFDGRDSNYDYDVRSVGELRAHLTRVASGLKSGTIKAHVHGRADSRRAFLDSLCDQIVTAVGVAHCAKMDIEGGLDEVTRSNWSKFVDGQPVFDANGKIAKGPNYTPPNLADYV